MDVMYDTLVLSWIWPYQEPSSLKYGLSLSAWATSCMLRESKGIVQSNDGQNAVVGEHGDELSMMPTSLE